MNNIKLYLKTSENYIKYLFFNKRTPLSVHFSLTNRCPLKCSYCGFFKRYREELNTQEVIRIIDQLAEAGNTRLHITGGEPMLRNDIGEIINYIYKIKKNIRYSCYIWI